ncbi:unnamed protein product [Cyprideis torosa]|uniref:Uncharacterized protein n=1 Tax=Cyprideis torosa TaxID=163714 RepID=A0A7R8WS07_9CRUS|nr:unnamed protein product [Cyprideis torosa]CAG0909085.1 unnamed protein product [Cyprideis torosa]
MFRWGGMAEEITVYYGALCPDSQRLIVNQIQPSIQRLPRYILDQVRLVPYGKSQTYIADGTYKFRCQHGSLECLASKYHASLFKYVYDPVWRISIANYIFQNLDLRRVNEVELRFVVESCCRLFQVDWNLIDASANGYEGSWLLAGYGNETAALNPPVNTD